MNSMQINYKSFEKPHWSDLEKENVKLLIGFVQALMNDHDFDKVRSDYNNSFYKQHNRGIPDGMENLIKYVGDFVKRYPDYCYDVKHIHADGDHVIFHSHISTKKKDRGNESKGINVMDSWRVENGQIVEHWDSLQAIDGPTRFLFLLIGGKIANQNGLF